MILGLLQHPDFTTVFYQWCSEPPSTIKIFQLRARASALRKLLAQSYNGYQVPFTGGPFSNSNKVVWAFGPTCAFHRSIGRTFPLFDRECPHPENTKGVNYRPTSQKLQQHRPPTQKKPNLQVISNTPSTSPTHEWSTSFFSLSVYRTHFRPGRKNRRKRQW